MHRFFSRVLAFFGRKADSEVERKPPQRLLEGNTKFKNVQGVVTRSYTNYGWIDESIFFSTDVVTDKVPLKVGQKVTAVVEEDETSHGLKAIKVDAFHDDCHGDGSSDSYNRVSFGCTTSLMDGTDYINHTAYFCLDVVCKDFEPYQGDLVEIEFSIEPDMQGRKALLVKPLRHKHINKVCITKIHGRHGVMDNSIFFTLDSLKLPAGYVPQLYDIVDVVIVESIHSCYNWRAISMTPVQMSWQAQRGYDVSVADSQEEVVPQQDPAWFEAYWTHLER